VTGLCFAFGPVHASNLLPGRTMSLVPDYSYGMPLVPSGSPGTGVPVGAGPWLQDSASWTPTGSGTPSANITFENAIYLSPLTGDLDFLYQIQNIAAGSATAGNMVGPTLSLSDFSRPGVAITGVAQITNAVFLPLGNFAMPTAGGPTIASVVLSANKHDLTVDLSAPIAPEQNSAILIIETNATGFNRNAAAVVNWQGVADGTGTPAISFAVDAFQPVMAPEPGFYGILSVALAGLLLFARWRRIRTGHAGN